MTATRATKNPPRNIFGGFAVLSTWERSASTMFRTLLLAGAAALALASPTRADDPPPPFFDFQFSGSIDTFTIPETASYTIIALGAQGGNSRYQGASDPNRPPGVGGRGAAIVGVFDLNAGDQIFVAVGGRGNDGDSGCGGGGSFVVKAGPVALLIAGGGGGAGGNTSMPLDGGEGRATEDGGPGLVINGIEFGGGQNGQGGRGGIGPALGGAGGAGVFGNGEPGFKNPPTTPGLDFLSGLLGGMNSPGVRGPFGGGGCGFAGGGGGGYSGGGGGRRTGGQVGPGGGGGSFNAGTDQVMTPGVRFGDGEITIIKRLKAPAPPNDRSNITIQPGFSIRVLPGQPTIPADKKTR